MGEKNTFILFGLQEKDLPECPNPEGWAYWAEGLPQVSDYPPEFKGMFIHASYEANPACFGLIIEVLDYAESWVPHESEKRVAKARRTWESLRKIASKQNVTLPEGYVIITVDE